MHDRFHGCVIARHTSQPHGSANLMIIMGPRITPRRGCGYNRCRLGYDRLGKRVTVVRPNCDRPLGSSGNQRPDGGVAMPSFGISCFGQRSMTTLSPAASARAAPRSEEHTSELQSRPHLVCRLLLEK